MTSLADARMVWLTWWLGDALGAVLYAPALILLWTDRRPRTRQQLLESAVVGSVLLAVSIAVFRGSPAGGTGNYPIGFICIPVALWPAFRLGQRETAMASVL